MESLTDELAELREAWNRAPATAASLIGFWQVSQAKLARAMGTDRQTLSSRLTGKTKFQTWELDGLARLLGVPLEVLKFDRNDALQVVLNHPEWQPADEILRSVKCLHTYQKLLDVAA
jgi:hypothetical protein